MVFHLRSDPRLFTDYSHCSLDKKIMGTNGIKDQKSYKEFLQKNAEKIMEINKQAVIDFKKQ